MKQQAIITLQLSADGRILSADDCMISECFFTRGGFLVDHMHVNDRIAVLGFLDDLRQNGFAEDVGFRLLHDGVVIENCLMRAVDCSPSGATLSISISGNALSKIRMKSGQEVPLLSAVAHEMRAPLNAIIGFSEFLLHEIGACFENEMQREYASLIKKSGAHLLDIVSGYLSHEAEQVCNSQAAHCDVDMIVHDCMAMTSSLTRGREVTFERSDNGQLYAALGDTALRQILINLLSNAAKYTADGGKISIRRLYEGRSMVTLEVSDNGIGMSPEELARIGQPYMRMENDVNREVEGSGLGLALMRSLVQSCGGAIKIFSTCGQGTTVVITLPLAVCAIAVSSADSFESQAMAAFENRDRLSHVIHLTELRPSHEDRDINRDNGKKEKKIRKSA